MRIADGALDAREKSDATPVTAADEASEAVLLTGLDRLLPGIDIVSEEAAARAAPRKPGDTFMLVDPLDGTREILAGRDEYTINVAIIHRGRPVAGLLAAPARALIWRGAQAGRRNRCSFVPARVPIARSARQFARGALRRIVRWRSSAARIWIRRRKIFWRAGRSIEQQGCGSALKFGLLAQGDADIYPRLAPTSEWDIAAGDAILTGAGGLVVTPRRQPVLYGRHDGGFRIPAFIALGDAAACREVLHA